MFFWYYGGGRDPICELFSIFADPLFARVWRQFHVYRKVRNLSIGRQVIFANFFSDTSRSLDYLGHFIFTFSSIRNSKNTTFCIFLSKVRKWGHLPERFLLRTFSNFFGASICKGWRVISCSPKSSQFFKWWCEWYTLWTTIFHVNLQ